MRPLSLLFSPHLSDHPKGDKGISLFLILVIIALGSFNESTSKCRRDSLVVCFVNSMTSILAGFVVFGVIGYMSHITGLSIKEVTTEGPGLVFLVYPKGIQFEI
jgi:SNF family Na+-dependent transporter